MSWSQITDTELELHAYTTMNDNQIEGCHYHHNDHIAQMYRYLEVNNVPYDEALDWAVMFHDIIYDSLPDKESRSAEYFMTTSDIYRGCNLDEDGKQRVYDLILATKDHLVDEANTHRPTKGRREIIMADLHGLTEIKTTILNYSKILEESLALYEDIDVYDFARENVRYMKPLRERMSTNIKRSDSRGDRIFFQNIINGINLTVLFSKSILNV